MWKIPLGYVLLVHAFPVLAENLVRNGGFEEGATGWNLPPLYAIDPTVAHRGQHSLRYHNEPGGPYLIAGQGLPLKPGKCYRMSVWVKAEGIVSSDTGATISMEWGGKEGYVGGSYPPGITGTFDWQQIVFETGVVPQGITGGSIILYGRPGTSGTAWFDDVEVVELEAPLARFRFEGSPETERKKTILAGLKSPEVRLEAELSPGREVELRPLLLSAKVYASGPPTELQDGSWRGNIGELAIPTDTLPFGESQVEVSLVDRASHRPLMSEFLSLEKKPLLRLEIVAPNPAGAVGVGPPTGGGGASRSRLVARVNVERSDPQKVRRYRARLFLLGGDKVVRQGTWVAVTDRRPGRLGLSLEGLDFGLYDLRCELFAEGSQEPLARAQRVGTHANPAERPANATWIGPHRMLRVEGKPFLPVGFYILSSLEGVFPADQPWRWNTGQLHPDYYLPILDRLSKSNFNCVIDYGSVMGGIEQARAFMDAAWERGLRTIFSVKDLMPGAYWEVYTQNLPWKDLREATRHVVQQFRGHPSLIAWYVNDEVIRPEHWPGVVDVFRITREVDPWHPTYAVHYDYKHLSTYREACDIIGTDPYTLTGDIGFTARSWREARRQLPPEQPFWAVVQCFGPGYETSNPSDTREPTYDEERAATLAALAEGATGIIYYCFHSLQRSPRFEERFAELDRIAGEVEALLPILALPDACEPVRVEAGDLSVLTKQGRESLLVLLASTSRTDQQVALRLPFVPKSVRDVQTGEASKADGDRLVLPFKALDGRVLQVEEG